MSQEQDFIPANDVDTVNQKLADADTPGFVVEFDPDEAERAGFFVESALDMDDALEARE